MGPLPSSGSVTLAALAADWTEFLSSSGNYAFTVVQVASLPGARGSARRLRAATVVPPWCRHADAALSNLAASVASRAGSRRRVAAPSVYSISHVPSVYSIGHGRIVVRSPRSTDLNLLVQLIRPSLECSWAGRIYRSLSARKREIGVFVLPLGRCAPRAWLTRPSEWVISLA